MTVAEKGSLRDLGVDGVVLTRDAGDGLEQHVESWVSGLVTCIATKFLFSVDRNLVAWCSVTTGSSSFVARCNVAAWKYFSSKNISEKIGEYCQNISNIIKYFTFFDIIMVPDITGNFLLKHPVLPNLIFQILH